MPRPDNITLHDDIKPIKLDSNVTFNSIGGLEEHIKCLREMVLFPLFYRDFFKRYNSQPPKGVLFHGPPGTGKTLLAKALANECCQMRGKKVSFFMSKGADIMSKWYGESEKYLKSLFKKAKRMRPSIIFFDEIDTLAPTRTENQSEVFCSLVGALLIELDGICDRGDVIIIGATNRPDCVDAALRRPGRFDRELYFPPPSLLARRDILDINTRHWLPRPTESMLDQMAQLTSGYFGSDLSALCSEAVLRALRRVYPQLYDGDLVSLSAIDEKKVEVALDDLMAAKRAMCPSGARYTQMAVRHLPEVYDPLLGDQVRAATAMMKQIFPGITDAVQEDVTGPYVFLICGDSAEVHLAPAILAQLENCEVHELSMTTLHSSHVCTQERAIISIFSECRCTERPCVIFIPNVKDVWESLRNISAQTLLLQQWRTRAAGDKALLMATCHGSHSDLPEPLQDLFPPYKNCVYNIRKPTPTEVTNFLNPILEKLPSETDSRELSLPSTTSQDKSNPSSIMTTPTTHVKMCGSSRKRKNGIEFRPDDFKRSKYSNNYNEDNRYKEREREEYQDVDFRKLLMANVENLCNIGLEALTDLYSQLCNAINSSCRDSNQLPPLLNKITARYLNLTKNSSYQRYIIK